MSTAVPSRMFELDDRFGLIPVLMLSALCGLPGCDDSSDAISNQAQPPQPIAEVKQQSKELAGSALMLTGSVANVMDARAIEVEAGVQLPWGIDNPFADDDIMVFTKTPMMLGGEPPVEGRRVFVSGRLEVVDAAEAESVLGWNPTQALKEDWGTRTIVVADAISELNEVSRWAEAEEQGALLSLIPLASNPAPLGLAGRWLELPNAKVTSVSERSFWVEDDDGNALLVEAPQRQLLPNVDDVIEVRGELKVMPSSTEAMKRFGVPPSERQRIEAHPLYLDAKQLLLVSIRPGG